MEETKIEQASAEIGGQKFSITGTNLNTLFTIAGFIVTALIAWVLWSHTGDSKDANRAFVEAVKEQTVAMKDATVVQRELNCLMGKAAPEFCRRISR